MNKLVILAVLLLYLESCCKPHQTEFEIIRFNLDNQKDSLAYENWKRDNFVWVNNTKKDTLKFTDGTVAGTLFYEDKDYKVFTSCNGEFGGSIIFQEKRNKNALYYMESVCTVMIDKRENGYYIVESLAHLSGFGSVRLVESPKSLVHLELNKLTRDWRSKKFPRLSEYDIYCKLKNQGKVLIEQIDVTYNMMFQCDNKNYLIYSRNDQTLVGEIMKDTLLPVDTLFHFNSYSFSDTYRYNVKNYRHYEFKRESLSMGEYVIETEDAHGEIYVRKNTIVCAYSDRKRKTKQKQ